MRYSTTWRNKWLTSDCESLKEMAEQLRGAADYLEEIDKAGILLDCNGMNDDYARLYTEDKELAEKYGLSEDEYDDEDFNDDELNEGFDDNEQGELANV